MGRKAKLGCHGEIEVKDPAGRPRKYAIGCVRWLDEEDVDILDFEQDEMLQQINAKLARFAYAVEAGHPYKIQTPDERQAERRKSRLRKAEFLLRRRVAQPHQEGPPELPEATISLGKQELSKLKNGLFSKRPTDQDEDLDPAS